MIRFILQNLLLIITVSLAFVTVIDQIIVADASLPQQRQRSLVIIIDTTGSMTSVLEQVCEGARDIIEYAAGLEDKPFYNFIFVDFNDPNVEPALVTTDKDELIERLRHVTIKNDDNPECPELAMEGIRRGLERTLYKSFVFVFTDADAKDYHLEHEVARLIVEKQVTITFFITEGCAPVEGGYQIYRRLAKQSGGGYYDIDEYDISSLLQFTNETLNINRDLVYSEDFENETQATYVISENTSDITVSVTGLEPQVDFTDPAKNKVNVIPEVDLNNVMINQIINPMPGTWVIDIKVNGGTGNLQITQVNPLTFEFGFSLSLPKSIKETFVRPLQGVQNHLVVAPINVPSGSTFTHVTITTDKTTEDHDLREFEPGLFTTDAFEPPEIFKLTINGKDPMGNDIQRLISTYIQPAMESKPIITIVESEVTVPQYGEILLSCTAKSFSKMTVKWTKNGKVLKEIETSQSYELDYSIPVASLDDQGEYLCEASNQLGMTESMVSVQVIPRPPPITRVTVHPEDKHVSPDDEIRITCKIEYPYDSTYWTFRHISENSEVLVDTDLVEADRTLVIPSVTINHAGTYTCVARVNETEVKDFAHIDVGHEAEIIDPEEETIVASTGSSVNLTCNATGEPEPEIQWFFVAHNDYSKELAYSTNTVAIDNLNFTHDGFYKCKAFNGVGDVQERIVELKVAALDEPRITYRTDALVVARTGEQRSLVCECEQCLPIRSYTWTFNDYPIDDTQVDNVRVNYSTSDTDSFRTTLTLDHVVADNDGVYKCLLENDRGSATHEIMVNVLRKPGIQRIIVSNNSLVHEDGQYIVQENQSLTLDCQTFGLIKTFDWYKDGVRISSGRYLKLDATTHQDSGVYRCAISNSKGWDAQSVTVQVLGHPKIVSEFPVEMVKYIGQALEVECKASGSPLPTVRWANQDGEVVNATNGRLRLEEFIISFPPIFSCYAENTLGSDLRSMAMRYQQNLEIKEITFNDELFCPLLTDTVFWYKDNEPIEESSPMFGIENEILRFSRPDAYNYSGLYHCEFDQEKFYFNVTIIIPPTIDAIEVTIDGVEVPLENDEITVRVGQELAVRCLASGHPPPRVYWRTKRRWLENGNMLRLKYASKKHAGVYSCNAKLSATDKDSLDINLIVMP